MSKKKQAEDKLAKIEAFQDIKGDIEAEYKGNTVTLNKPFGHESGDLAVYAKNSDGEVVLTRFSGEPAPFSSDDPSTPSYWNEKASGLASSSFSDSVTFDTTTKTLRSVRDGVQNYSGIELGLTPEDKVFTVYRSPESITNIASKLDGLPVIYEHIDPSVTPTKAQTIATLVDTQIVEFIDKKSNGTLVLENKAELELEAIKLKDSGKKQFSLGYLAQLKKHDVYDFEQININPTHLALVDSARGGASLTFMDKRKIPMSIYQGFLDEEEAINMEKVVEIASSIPDVIKKLTPEQLAEVLPKLKMIAELAMPESAKDAEDVDSTKTVDELDEEQKEKFEDSALYKSIIEKNKQSFADSQAFADAVDKAVISHAAIIDRAKTFVDDKYAFVGKSNNEIMRDALKTEHGDMSFEDSELTVAFKVLKKSETKPFGFTDEALKDLSNKEL